MPSSYTPSLRLTLPITGELTGTWGDTVNSGITTLIDSSISGTASIVLLDADYTLSVANGVTDESRKMFIVMTGTLTGDRNVICPNVSKLYFVTNNTTGGYSVTFKTSAGTGIVVQSTKSATLYCDGSSVFEAINQLGSLTLNAPLPVLSGGTGTTTSTGTGNTVLSISPTLATPVLGTPQSVTLTNGTGLPITTGVSGLGSGIATFLATPSSANLATAVTDETGTGSLVFANTPTLIAPNLGTPTSGVATNLTGIATGLTAGNVNTNANLTGGVTSIGNAATVVTNANLTGVITSVGNATSIASQTGTGTKFVVDNSPTIQSPTLTAPVLDTPVSGNFSSGTFTWPTFNQNTTGTAAGLSVALAVASGGTGATNDASARSNLSAAKSGANTDITSVALTAGTITTAPSADTDIANKTYVDTIAAQGIHYHNPVYVESPDTAGNLNATYNQPGGAGVGVGATLTNAGTQVALTIDGILMTVGKRVLIYNQTNAAQNGIYTVTTVGTVSTNWVLTRATDADTYAVFSPAGLGQGDAFFVQAGNTGAGETYVVTTVGVITFGSTGITFAQISSAPVYTAGTGLTLSGANQFSITNTGVSAATYGSASQVPVLITNAQGQITSVTDTAIAITGAAVSGNIAGNAANVTGIVDVLNGGTGVTTSTGTGDVVLSLSPTLVTPALGTPSALVGTNITGTATAFTASNVTTNANLTGMVTSVGNAASLGSFTSAQLAAALTDETGSGLAVFATSPTLVTPDLGTPSAGVVTNLTGTASININGTVGATTATTGAFTTVVASTSVSVGGVLVPTISSTSTLTNKRINPRSATATTATTLTPDLATLDQTSLTALATALTINAPTGTPVDGSKMTIRLKDNGTARALTWNATYVPIGNALPTTTVANKIVYIGCSYNLTAAQWDIIAVTQQL